VLVSHWENSTSTVKLITKALSELKAMVSLITSGKVYEAHPAFWAPFMLVGEGVAALNAIGAPRKS
jgi:CHAT domain-containing protein